MANYAAQTNESYELLSVDVISPKDNVEMKLTLNTSDINQETILREQLGAKGTSSTFDLNALWDYSKLLTLDQPGNVNLSFSCEMEGTEIDNKSMTLSYRSVNECVYAYIDENNEVQDLSWMFAGYVNEDHPLIDEFLAETLDRGLVDSFKGYQGTSDEVFMEVFAIWHNLHMKGVKYSSITDTSNPTDKVFSQHVRFFDEVYNNDQANCVDGSAFISSILKKLGIKPVLILVPGHMYMGYYLDADKSELRLLETTAIGMIDLSNIYEQDGTLYANTSYVDDGWITQEMIEGYYNGLYTIDAIRKLVSESLFIMATNYRIDDFNTDLEKFNGDEMQYKLIDIEDMRSLVQPIGG